jgi:hypothetical protein
MLFHVPYCIYIFSHMNYINLVKGEKKSKFNLNVMSVMTFVLSCGVWYA